MEMRKKRMMEIISISMIIRNAKMMMMTKWMKQKKMMKFFWYNGSEP